MTLRQAPVLVAPSRPAARHPLPVAVGAGIALGVADLLLQLTLPYPWADLANSSAVWAVVVLLLTRFLGADERRSAAAGALTLVVAVEAYYGAAILLEMAGVAVLLAEAWQRADQLGTALLTAGLAAALLATVVRRPVLLCRTLPLVLVLTPACFVLFRVAGFGI